MATRNSSSRRFAPIIVSASLLAALPGAFAAQDEALLAHWRFEHIQHLKGDPTPSAVGEPLSADLGFLSVKRFWSETRVDVDAVLEPEFEFFAEGLSYTWSAEDNLTGEPLLKLNYTIPLGPTGLWVDVSPRLHAEASITAGLTGTVSAGASGGYGKTMTFDYVKDRQPEALVISAGANDFYFDLIEPEISLGGTVAAEFKLIPELDVKLVSLVGFYVNIDPTLGADLNADFSTASLVSADVGLGFDGRLNAGLSVWGIDNDLLPHFEPWELFSWGKRWYFPESLADPLEILVQPQDQVVQPGGTITLGVQANHDIGVTYEWRHNGRRLFSNSPTLRIYDASSAAGGDYQVTLRYGSEAVVSEVATVTIGQNGGILIVNIDARSNALGDPINVSPSPVSHYLSAGRYEAVYIGTAEGGLYDAWLTCCDQGWNTSYALAVGDTTNLLRNGWDLNRKTRYPTPEDALEAVRGQSFPFTLEQSSNVFFGVADNPYGDNAGGISLRIRRIGAVIDSSDTDFVVAGSPDGLSPFGANDFVAIDINGSRVFTDPSPTISDPMGPIVVTATRGDSIRIYAENASGNGGVSDIYLVDTATGAYQLLVSDTRTTTPNSIIVDRTTEILIP